MEYLSIEKQQFNIENKIRKTKELFETVKHPSSCLNYLCWIII